MLKMSEKQKRGYIMVGGTLLPAFVGVGIMSMVNKSNISFKDTKTLLLFAGLSVLGGMVTASILKDSLPKVDMAKKEEAAKATV